MIMKKKNLEPLYQPKRSTSESLIQGINNNQIDVMDLNINMAQKTTTAIWSNKVSIYGFF